MAVIASFTRKWCARRSTCSATRPEQKLEEFLRALRRQRVEPQLGVGGLASPAMRVPRAIIDEQQHAGSRQALH
jgi:hypothetical protein